MVSKPVIGLLVLGLFAPTPALAQSVEDCRAKFAEVQALIDKMLNPDSEGATHAQNLLIAAESEAAKGNGPKCMELVEEARNASKL